MWKVLIRATNGDKCATIHSYKTKREAVSRYLRFTRDGSLAGSVIQDIDGTIVDHTEAIEQFVAEN